MQHTTRTDSVSPSKHSAQSSVRDLRFCSWLLIASLILHIGAVLLTRQHETINTLDGDEKEYWSMATDFQKSGLSAVTARRTPPFPMLVAGIRSVVGDDYLHVQLALSTLLAVSPLLVFWLVRRRIGNEMAARLASAGVLLWPAFVRYDATLYCDSIGLLVFLCFLIALPLSNATQSANGRRWLQFCIAGGLLSLCIQTKPLYLIYIPFAVLFAFFSEKILKRRTLAAVCLGLGCVTVSLPWSAYLSAREGRFIAVSANGGETLAGGLNPALIAMDKNAEYVTQDGRSAWFGPGKWLLKEQTGYLSSEELDLPYVQTGALLNERTHAWILSHPSEAAYLTVRKFLYMWGIYPFWNGMTQSLLGNIPLILLLCAASVSLRRNRRSLQELAIFWTLPIFVSAVALVSWGSWRFRMPGDLGLIILAAMLPAIWSRQIRILPTQNAERDDYSVALLGVGSAPAQFQIEPEIPSCNDDDRDRVGDIAIHAKKIEL
jgi:4-amino-4-deoxy-L-arabinose transferase-like glycosyltransferase